MKLSTIGFNLIIVILIWGCDTKSDSKIEDVTLPETEMDKLEDTPKRAYTLEKHNQWVDYYTQNNSSFSMDNFNIDETFKIVRNETNITPIWSEEFQPVYKQFLAFNADSTQYIDIDSYKWGFDEQGELMIGPDQEIVLVNIPDKKVERILFYGPSFWVEEAYFKNDSIVVLLENSTDKIPAYQEINLNQNTSDYYIYNEPLEFESEYLKNRITGIYTDPM